MRRKLLTSLVGLLVLAVAGLASVLIAGWKPSLGLDLQGGISVTQEPVGAFSQESLDLAVERIRERVDSLGVAEPEILRQGDAVVVNLPGVKNQKQAEELVKVTGKVQLRPVLTDTQFGLTGCATGPSIVPTTSDTTPSGTTPPATGSTVPGSVTPSTAAAPTTVQGGPARQPSSGNSTTTSSTTPPGESTTTSSTVVSSTTSTSATPGTDGATTTVATGAPVTLTPVPPESEGFVIAKGGSVCKLGPQGGTGEVFQNDATARILDQSGWGVTVSLRGGSKGDDVWNALAARCFNGDATCPTKQLAIVLDNEVISAPTVQTANFSGSVQISGSFTEKEARDLARVINSGSLPVDLRVQAIQTVSPTLGKDSLHAALIAGLVGIVLVLLFMAFYYRTLGFIAAAGLAVSGSLIYATVSMLSETRGLALSLSGIAGLIVSVGVTIDSYVVFFERLKDEVRSGRSMRNSAQRGFAAAWHTIVVADLVSIIGAAVLWYLSVGSVRGFAFFLGLSTLTDLLVAYFFTRPAVLLLARTGFMARRKVMGIEVAGGAS